MRDEKFQKLVNLVIVLLPLFQCYNFFGISAGKILMLLFFIILLIFGKRKPVVTSNFKVFLVYAFTVPQLVAIITGNTSNFVGSFVTLGLYALCLCYALPYIEFDVLKKYYRFVVFIAVSVFALQEISALTFGKRFSALIPFLTLYNDVPASQYAAIIANEDRSCSLFVEPSHFAQYLAPFLAITLCGLSKKHKLFDTMSIVLSLVLLLLRSGNGLLLLAFIWILHIIFVDIKIVKKILTTTPLVAIVLFVALPKLLATDQGQDLLERQETMDVDYAGDSRSATIRIYRGFFVYGEAPTSVKTLGVGVGGADDVIDHSAFKWMFFNEHYLNNASGFLISYGWVGTFLFLLFLFRFRGNKEKGRFVALGAFLVLSFMERFMFDTRMLLYLCAIYACSLVGMNMQTPSIPYSNK